MIAFFCDVNLNCIVMKINTILITGLNGEFRDSVAGQEWLVKNKNVENVSEK